MANRSVVYNDILFQDDIEIAGNFTFPAGSVLNTHVGAAADIVATKVRHQHALKYSQAAGSDVTTEDLPMHIFRSAADLVAVEVVCETAPTGGDKQFTVDVQKGNASTAYATVLSSVVTVDNTSVDRTIQVGTLSTTTAADGDQLKVIITASGSTGTQAQDCLVIIWIREKPD